MAKQWTKEEDAYLLHLWRSHFNRPALRMLPGRSKQAVLERLKKLERDGRP